MMWEFIKETDVAASPQRVWQVVTDVSRHDELAGSGEILAIRMHGPLGVGSSWEADERIRGAGRFTATSVCVELLPPRRFSWRSIPRPIREGRQDSVADITWWFELAETPEGAHVEHGGRIVEPDVAGWMMRTYYALTRRARTIERGMEDTLQNVKQAAEAAPALGEG